MRTMILLAALTIPAASATSPSIPAPRAADVPAVDQKCARSGFDYAKDAGAKPQLKNLAELPTGNLVLTVLQEVDGCHKPVIVRQGYGALEREESIPAPRIVPRRW